MIIPDPLIKSKLPAFSGREEDDDVSDEGEEVRSSSLSPSPDSCISELSSSGPAEVE